MAPVSESLGVVWADDVTIKPGLHNRMKDVVLKLDYPPLREELRKFVDWVANYTLGSRGMVLRMALRRNQLEQARARDAEASEGRGSGPLHGRPVLVKDNVDTHDLPTTAGSLALADAPPPTRDAALVARLRAAGMVLLVAMIGAIVLTLRHKPGVRRQIIMDQVLRTPAKGMRMASPKPGEGIVE